MGRNEFFEALRSYWTPLPPGIQGSFLDQTKEFIAIENRLREDDSLAGYDQQIYPELITLLKIPPITEPPPAREVLHLCNNQLQMMENVFLALKLADYHAHPLNRGWMNLFRRWTVASMMRLLWPSLKSMHSKDFVKFAEYQLNLSGIRVKPERKEPGSLSPELFKLRDPKEAARLGRFPTPFVRLFRELGHEWPVVPDENLAMYFDPFTSSTDVWTVSHPEFAGEEIWGIALLAPHPMDLKLQPADLKVQRLMVWIRPAYRGVGLGTALLNAIFDKMNNMELLGLIVMLPPLRRDRPGYGDEMAGWLRFYGRKGFVRTTQKDAQRILGTLFDPAAFCLAMPELLERLRKATGQGDTSPRPPEAQTVK